jgi:hypothetical protein
MAEADGAEAEHRDDNVEGKARDEVDGSLGMLRAHPLVTGPLRSAAATSQFYYGAFPVTPYEHSSIA